MVKFLNIHDYCLSKNGCGEIGGAEGRGELFLCEYRSEVGRVYRGEVTISPFAVDVPLSSECIWLGP